MTLQTKSIVKLLSGSKKHSDKSNTDFYKISLLSSTGEAGNLSCTEAVYNSIAQIEPMTEVQITINYCDDYDKPSFKVFELVVNESSRKASK